MSEEGYKPNEEEIRNAEGMMTPQQEKMTEVLNSMIESVRSQAVADGIGQFFDEILDTITVDKNNQNNPEDVNFHTKGVDVEFVLGFKWNEGYTHEDIKNTKISIDGVTVQGIEVKEALLKKYGGTVFGIANLGVDKMKEMVHYNKITNLLN